MSRWNVAVGRARLAEADQRGSLALAMLAVIIVAGAVTVLLTSTITGQKAARYDRSYTTVVQAADAGIQEAAHQIIRGQMDPTITDGTTTAPANGGLGDATYQWEATKINEIKWEITSTGDLNGVERTLHAVIEDQPRFFFAAYADTSIEMRGGNNADSYGESWFTGNGVVGSNGDVRLNGASSGVDAVHLFNWDNYADFNRCEHVGGTDCNDVLTTPDATFPSLRIGPRMELGSEDGLETAFIDEQLAECIADSPTGTLTSYTSSVNGSSLPPAGEEVLCFEDVTFDSTVTITSPVGIYVAGAFAVTNAQEINMDCGGLGCPTTVDGPLPVAADLQIYSAGGPVILGNHTKVGAAIYAPESSCGGNPSNAQGAIYGSMICGTITNRGGWSFHYDDRLREIGTGEFHMKSWREDN